MSGTCPECGTPNPKHHWGTTYFCENPNCGAMLNMTTKPVTRNLYTALLFKERPDLHLTVRYYPKVAQRGPWECELVQQIGALWATQRPQPFVLNCSERAMFGPRRNVPVLKATGEWPQWVENLRMVVPMPVPDTYPFNPHVTTADDPMVLTVESIGLCHKSEVVWRWELR